VGKYLVVANQTLGGDQLMDEVRRRAAAGPSSFYVVVPNTRSIDVAPASGAPLPPGSSGVGVEEQDHRATLIAQSRLNQALGKLRAEGLDAQGDLGDSEPLTAIGDALEGAQFDEIIISTLPGGISRWLGMDLPSRTERKFKLPVTTVTSRG
jgi:GABA permease